MQLTWILLVVFCALLAELAAGGFGLAVPFLAVVVFYLSTVYGWRLVTVPALLAGAVLDVTLGRHAPVTALLVLPLVISLARFWRHEGVCRYLMVQTLPGAFLGLIQAAVLLSVESFMVERFFWRLLFHNLWVAAELCVAGMLALPSVCAALDWLARLLALPRYQEVQERRPEHGS